MQDENEKWFYFRFWNPSTAAAIFADERLHHMRQIYDACRLLILDGTKVWAVTGLAPASSLSSVSLNDAVWDGLRYQKFSASLLKLSSAILATEVNPHNWAEANVLSEAHSWYNANVRDNEALAALTRACVRTNLDPKSLARRHAVIWDNQHMTIQKKSRLMLKATKGNVG